MIEPSRMFCSPNESGRKRVLVLLLMTVITGGGALKGVSVVVPQAASIGDTVTLQCRYDLEGEELYTLKWYKGGREFYRFIPKELPNTQVFPYQDLDVDLAKSNQKAIVLRSLRPEHTGRYKCEVSTDAPNFYTQMESSYMYVVSVPEGKPEMYIEKDSYELGYTLRGNCTSPPSYPALNLTWYINGHKVNASYTTRLPDLNSNDGKRMVTVSGLELEIDGNTFQGGKAKIRCSASLFNLYHAQEDDVLVEERPRPNPSSVLGTRESSSGSRYHGGILLMNVVLLIHTLILR